MAKKILKLGVGARYGASVRHKFAEVKTKQNRAQICPFCKREVRRLSKGIWQCKRCGKKFASHAYYIEQ